MSVKNIWWEIKMKNGGTFDISDEKYTALKKVLGAEWKERPEFITLPDGEMLRVDFIAYVSKERSF
jgi:hypothetical protein